MFYLFEGLIKTTPTEIIVATIPIENMIKKRVSNMTIPFIFISIL